MESDFTEIAKAWVDGDKRTENLEGERREKLVARIAAALAARRASTPQDDTNVGLIVNIDKDGFVPGKGLKEDVLTKLTEYVQERIEDEGLEQPESGEDKS